MFQRNHNYSQHCNKSGVSVSTNVFEVYMLQVKVNLDIITILMSLFISYDQYNNIT